jgi:hypothetical protein
MVTRDWKSLAKASGLNIPAKELDALGPPLEALEEAFRPLVKDLSPDLEPIQSFRVEADVE